MDKLIYENDFVYIMISCYLCINLKQFDYGT